MKTKFKTMVCILATCTASALLLATANAATKEDFILIKGKGMPVCEAYLKRLKQTDFVAPPYCDRPENTSVPGFAKLNRVYLNADEVIKLHWQVMGMKMSKDRDWYDKQSETLYDKQRGGKAETKRLEAVHIKDRVEVRVKLKEDFMRHYRYMPAIDIDNDGKPDELIVWREEWSTCGNTYGNDPNPRRTSTYIFLLDSQGNVDVNKTIDVLGHPKGDYSWEKTDRKTGKTETKTSPKFRSISMHMGLFVFEGKTYLEGFYDSWGDIENQRVKQKSMFNTLAVFKREGGKIEAVCEYLWQPKAEK